ncbi:MAG: hypothetical protein Q4G52_03190 [Clostridia bacterium]|nr:hypothetical protein [Clostridia bacterium]
MRILVLPLTVLAAVCLYLSLPRLAPRIGALLVRLYALVCRAFTRKDGRADERPALLVFLLLLGGSAALISAVHPLLGVPVCAPLLTGFSFLPSCVKAKAELDAGQCAGNVAGYEARVRQTCASLAPAFVGGVFAPLLLLAVGTPLYLGCSLPLMFCGLRALSDVQPDARRAYALLLSLSDAVVRALLVLCSGVAGRNPLHTAGRTAQQRLMSILGIAGDGSDTHPPISGDITQAVFLCCFVTGLLTLLLSLLLIPLA